MFRKKAVRITGKPKIYEKTGKKDRKQRIWAAADILTAFVLLLFLSAGCTLAYDSVFAVDGSGAELFCSTAVVETFLFVIYLVPVLKKFAPCMAAGGFLIGFFVWKEEIVTGLKQCGNLMIRMMNAHQGTEIPLFQGLEKTVENQAAVYFVSLLFLWWFVETLFRIKKVWLLAVPPLLIICGELLLGRSPDEVSVIMVSVSFFALLAFAGGNKAENQTVSCGLQGKAAWFLLAALAISFFLAHRYGGGTAEKIVKLQDETLLYQQALEQQLMEYLSIGLAAKNPGRVSNKAPQYKQVDVISVTTDKVPGENLYLRGYVGDVYRSGNWINQSQLEFEESVSDFAYGDKREAGMYVLNLFYRTQSGLPGNRQTRYVMEYLDTEDDYAYLPYLVDLEHVGTKNQEVFPLLLGADAMVYRKGQTCLVAEGVAVQSLLYDTFSEIPYEGSGAIESSYQEYLERYLWLPGGLAELKRLGTDLHQELNRQYNMIQKTDSLAGTREAYAAYLVREAIFSRVSYSLELDRIPFGEDVVEYFLFESKQGFCKHYASAGVLLLREMGIPARYVSGYVVRPDDFEALPDGSYTAKVKDSAAHAWAEVYIRHVGWIPVEMTEGSGFEAYGEDVYQSDFYEPLKQPEQRFPDDGDESSSDEQGEEEALGQPESGEEEASKQESEAETAKPESGQENVGSGQDINESQTEEGYESLKIQEGGGEDAGSESRTILLLAVYLLGVCTGGLGMYVYYRTERRRTEAFRQKNYRKAVKEITACINRILRKKGILKKRDMDDSEYKKTLIKELSTIDVKELQEYFSVLERAAFSNESLEKEDVHSCYRIYREIKGWKRET